MFVLVSALVIAAAPAPKNVVECFLALPDTVPTLDKMALETKEAALKQSSTVIDLKNGFLSFKTDWDSQGQSDPYTVQVAIFQRTDKKFIVAVARDDVFDQPVSMFQLVDGEWLDVTANVLPELTQSDFWTSKKQPPALVSFFYSVYRLPQLGTTITVSRLPWVKRHWDDGRDDVSTPEERALQDAAEDEASASIRKVSLVWNAKKGVFTKRY
jgi:hypothetical protein